VHNNPNLHRLHMIIGSFLRATLLCDLAKNGEAKIPSQPRRGILAPTDRMLRISAADKGAPLLGPRTEGSTNSVLLKPEQADGGRVSVPLELHHHGLSQIMPFRDACSPQFTSRREDIVAANGVGGKEVPIL